MKAILACEKNGGIGYKGSIPWPKDDKDLARFKELTLNTVVIMGRKTWESADIPKPLPDRTNIVISSNKSYIPNDAYLISKLNDINYLPFAFLPRWIIGGAELVSRAWDQIDELHLSRLRHEYECDTYIDLEKLEEDFYCDSSQICMSHTYEIWKKK